MQKYHESSSSYSIKYKLVVLLLDYAYELVHFLITMYELLSIQ